MARRLVYYVACTADGFIARADGSFDFFPHQGEYFKDLTTRFPETFPTHVRHLFGAEGEPQWFDTVPMGHKTYEVGVRVGITNPYAPLRQFVVSRSSTLSPDPAVQLHSGNPVLSSAPSSGRQARTSGSAAALNSRARCCPKSTS